MHSSMCVFVCLLIYVFVYFLLVCLFICLFIVGGVYMSLYAFGRHRTVCRISVLLSFHHVGPKILIPSIKFASCSYLLSLLADPSMCFDLFSPMASMVDRVFMYYLLITVTTFESSTSLAHLFFGLLACLVF